MQPRPSFDRTLLIPIAIGLVSILGMGWILLTSDLGPSILPPTIPPTATPFSFSSLETTTLPPAPTATPTREEIPPTATEAGPAAYPNPPAETLPATVTATSESPPTPTASTTPDRSQFLPAGKYDDTDSRIDYGLRWTALKNPGTANAYRGTLHASNSIGNEASFRFTGTGVRLGYQRGRNFGIVTVIVDGQSYSFHEQAFDLVWRSPPLAPGEHVVRIIHESGETVNLDYIEILD